MQTRLYRGMITPERRVFTHLLFSLVIDLNDGPEAIDVAFPSPEAYFQPVGIFRLQIHQHVPEYISAVIDVVDHIIQVPVIVKVTVSCSVGEGGLIDPPLFGDI